ncbi:MAG: hypothetical protein WBI41_07375 [Azovibrio sp.]|uniref:hypothetical protein n=1 Tax=Azovibrio sp. TaxID=1872673 RepID=UPI003C75568C
MTVILQKGLARQMCRFPRQVTALNAQTRHAEHVGGAQVAIGGSAPRHILDGGQNALSLQGGVGFDLFQKDLAIAELKAHFTPRHQASKLADVLGDGDLSFVTCPLLVSRIACSLLDGNAGTVRTMPRHHPNGVPRIACCPCCRL